MIKVLRKLVDQGNSLVVVDHNVDIISAADEIIEIGPGSGEQGGEIWDQGSPVEIKNDPQSLIAPYLNGKAKLMARKTSEKVNTKKITLMGLFVSLLVIANILTIQIIPPYFVLSFVFFSLSQTLKLHLVFSPYE